MGCMYAYFVCVLPNQIDLNSEVILLNLGADTLLCRAYFTSRVQKDQHECLLLVFRL